jgi:hypothetical protein
MRSLLITTLSGAALLGFASPSMAHPTYGDDQHQDQHEQIDEQHADTHEQVNDIHADAHDQGLSGYEHRQLHRQLNRAHDRADDRLEAQHYYQHQYNQNGYGGYNNGYSAQQGYYGSDRYNGNNRGYNNSGYGRTRQHRHNHYRGY